MYKMVAKKYSSILHPMWYITRSFFVCKANFKEDNRPKSVCVCVSAGLKVDKSFNSYFNSNISENI